MKRWVVVALVAGVAAFGCKKKEEPPPPSTVTVVTPPPVVAPTIEKGAAIFQQKCVVCHKVGGVGGTIGTDLTTVGTRHDAVYLQTLLKDPKQYYPQGVKMPAFADMSQEDMDALIAYLLTLKEEKK